MSFTSQLIVFLHMIFRRKILNYYVEFKFCAKILLTEKQMIAINLKETQIEKLKQLKICKPVKISFDCIYVNFLF